MQYRTVGNTDLRVSEIGFGCGGTAGLMINAPFEEQLQTVARAIELGINYFDESPDYGDGVSETNLGKVLKELGVRPVITTKVEVRAENLDDIAGHVERSVEASLDRLGVDYVDIVQIHNGPVPTQPNLQGRAYNILWIEHYLARNGALEGLERIRRAGKTRYIGFICRGNDGPQVRQLIDTGMFHLINVVYTLLNPTAVVSPPQGAQFQPDWGEVIPYARERGVGAAIYSPLAGGMLTDHILSGGAPHPNSGAAAGRGRGRGEAAPAAGGPPRAEAAEGARGSEGGGMADARQRNLARAGAFRFLSQGEQQSLAQAAHRFILMEPGVTTVLGGFSDVHQLEEGVSASGVGSLTPEQIVRVEMVWRASYRE